MKKVRILLCIIIIINLIISILLILAGNDEKKESDSIYYSGSVELDGKILPQNHYMFEEKVNDEEMCDELYKNIYYLVKKIYNLYEKTSKFSDFELKKFYIDNKNSLYNIYNLKTEENFLNLIKRCREIYSDGKSEYSNAKILMEQYKEKDGHIICQLEIEFKNSKILKYEFDIVKEKNEKIVINLKTL